MKRILTFFIIILLTIFCKSVRAESASGTERIYDEQFKLMEIQKLNQFIPKNALDSMKNAGIENANWEQLSKINTQNILKEIFKTFSQKISSSILSIAPILAIIFLSAIVLNLKTSFANKNISNIMSSVSVLCLCSSLITPMVTCICQCSVAIKSAAGFILCETPIIVAILAASGHPISGASSQTLIMGMGQIISYFASNFLVPFMNILLGISLISAISPKINLSGICDAIYKISKSLFKFTASIFTGILTVQNIVTTSEDNLKSEAAKFTIDNCVPIVGGAVSDAFSTVQGCLKLLKSGIGAFGIVALGAIFLPIIAECSSWIILLNLSKGISDIFEIKKVSFLLKSVGSVISVMMAAIIFVMMVMIVSTVILMIVGR